MRKLTPILALLALAVLTSGSLPLQNGHDQFQKALAKERGEGKLEEAIGLYRKVIDQTRDEALAAKAQLRIGICYEKLGREKSGLAQEAFQNVIDKYPKQIESVRAARDKLSNLLDAMNAGEIVVKECNTSIVWQGAGMDDSGEISPDRQYLSCVDWETGDLAVRHLVAKITRRLTDKGAWADSSASALTSVWSPDSKQIAYTWYDYVGSVCDLRIIDINTRKLRILYHGDYYSDWIAPLDWSPDGKYILVLIAKEENNWTLGLAAVKDSSIIYLKTIHGLDFNLNNARVSPDGKYIVYEHPQTSNSRKRDISLISIDGRKEFSLVNHPSNDRLMGWTPDGKRIVFISDRTGTWDCWISTVTEKPSQDEQWLIRRNIGNINPMGFTRNGSLYYSTPNFQADIFHASIDPETGDVTAGAGKYPLSYEGFNIYPDLSPDGKELAYVSIRNPRALCLYSLESGLEREISLKGNFRGFGYPEWCPDGHSLLIHGSEVEQGSGYFKVDVITGDASLIIPEPAWSPDISPDGKTVYYVKKTSKEYFQIMKKDLPAEKESEFCRILPLDNHRLALSPDGNNLALMTMASKNMRALKILPLTGGDPVELCQFEKDHQVKYIGIAWSPDGQFVYFSKPKSGSEEGEWELWRIPSTGGDAQNLGLAMHRFMQPNIHPDGSRITFASYSMHENVGAIWVMENFLPNEDEASRGGRK